MQHWHDSNPWADAIVYVPIEELAAALAGGKVQIGKDGPIVDQTPERLLAQWRSYGDRLDAYILPCPDGRCSTGIRYGADGNEYLSPAAYDPSSVRELLGRHAPDSGMSATP